jgi:hypothetical protein
LKHDICLHCGTPLESLSQTYCSKACGASHDLADTPSRITGSPWVYAERQKGEYPAHTERGGKWLVFVDKARLDEVWAKKPSEKPHERAKRLTMSRVIAT